METIGDTGLWVFQMDKPGDQRLVAPNVKSEADHLDPRPVLALSLREKALALFRSKEIVRTKDLEAIGVPRQYPRMMCEEGLLERIGHGQYRLGRTVEGTVTRVEVDRGGEHPLCRVGGLPTLSAGW